MTTYLRTPFSCLVLMLLIPVHFESNASVSLTSLLVRGRRAYAYEIHFLLQTLMVYMLSSPKIDVSLMFKHLVKMELTRGTWRTGWSFNCNAFLCRASIPTRIARSFWLRPNLAVLCQIITCQMPSPKGKSNDLQKHWLRHWRNRRFYQT
jgi:hypothetical protein